jgi:hypothetical protein
VLVSVFQEKGNGRASLCQLAIIMQQMMALPKWRAVVMARTMSIFAETVKPLVRAKPIKLLALATAAAHAE